MANVSISRTVRQTHSAVIAAPLTVFTGVMSVLIMFFPELPTWLQLERDATVNGQWWRLFTGHMTHWSIDHLFWDLGVFVVLGWMCETRRLRLSWCMIASAAIAISGACLLWSSVETYRGLSGLDTALFAMLGVSLLREHCRGGTMLVRMFFAASLAGMFAKVFYEFVTGDCLFVNSASSGFVAVPLAHLVGACVGLAFGLASDHLDSTQKRKTR